VQGDGCQAGVGLLEHPWVLLSHCRCAAKSSWQGRWWAAAGASIPGAGAPPDLGLEGTQLLPSGSHQRWGVTPPCLPPRAAPAPAPSEDQCECGAALSPPRPPSLCPDAGRWRWMKAPRPFASRRASTGRRRSASAHVPKTRLSGEAGGAGTWHGGALGGSLSPGWGPCSTPLTPRLPYGGVCKPPALTTWPRSHSPPRRSRLRGLGGPAPA